MLIQHREEERARAREEFLEREEAVQERNDGRALNRFFNFSKLRDDCINKQVNADRLFALVAS